MNSFSRRAKFWLGCLVSGLISVGIGLTSASVGAGMFIAGVCIFLLVF